MRRLSFVLLAPLALSACLKPAPPPAAAPPEVVAGTASVSLSTIPAATVSGWLGTWKGAGRNMTIARAGDMLTADGQPLKFVGLGTFTDASGTQYLFGPGETLRTYSTAGAEARWTR